MNCKPGDLAVIVRSIHGNLGKIVRCLRFLGHQEFDDGIFCDDAWLVEGRFDEVCFVSRRRGGDATISDSDLRPIRDQPGEDEMLRIAGKPQDQREPA